MYYSTLPYSGSEKNCSPIGYFAALLLLSAMLNGCATNTSSSPPRVYYPSTHHSGSSSHKRSAYNKPYKVRGHTYYPMASAHGYSESGIASWYGSESGNRTAMGTRFTPHALTAAHKTLPLPSKVRVTNLHNGRSVIVLVNDRGPFKKGRLIDLSHGAAKKIGIKGLARVRVEYLG